MKLALAVAAFLMAFPLFGEGPKKVEFFSSDEIRAQAASLAEKGKEAGGGNSVLGDYGTHSMRLSTRTASAGAEIHAHFTDIMVVREGQATLMTGGTVVDPHEESPGETRGTRLEGASSQILKAGDVFHVPAGTPHQTIVAPGTIYVVLVVKVKE